MPLTNALRRVVHTWRAFGPSAALHEARHRAINRVTPFFIFECARLLPCDVNPQFLDAGSYRAGFARPDEMLAVASAENDLPADFVAEAFDRGDECFAIHDGDRLASYRWFTRRPTPLRANLVIHFDPGWRYAYKGFTHPDYRGKRLHGIGLTLAARTYAAAGERGILSCVQSTNFPSLRSRQRTGQQIVGKIYMLRLGPRWLTWSTPGCRPYGFRMESVRARSTPDERA